MQINDELMKDPLRFGVKFV